MSTKTTKKTTKNKPKTVAKAKAAPAKILDKKSKPAKKRVYSPGSRAGKGGRKKTTFKEKFDALKFTNESIFAMAKRGFTDEAIAEVLGVSPKTVQRWKQEAETTKEGREFLSAMEAGRSIADEMLIGSLFHRAKGYSHKELYIAQFQGNIVKEEIEKHYPPDIQALKFWLMNRRPGEFREKIELNVRKMISMNDDEEAARDAAAAVADGIDL